MVIEDQDISTLSPVSGRALELTETARLPQATLGRGLFERALVSEFRRPGLWRAGRLRVSDRLGSFWLLFAIKK